jgi:hypothetical protein
VEDKEEVGVAVDAATLTLGVDAEEETAAPVQGQQQSTKVCALPQATMSLTVARKERQTR